MLQGRVVGDRVQRRHRLLQGQVPGQRPVLDHAEHQRRRADLEQGRDLAEGGVADDHVQAPVAVGGGVRLVAGVDDRPLERRLQAHLDLEEVRALADLVPVGLAVLPQADPAGAGEHLAGHEERRQVPGDVGERRRAPHQVVLVRAVRRPLAVGVVLVDVERRHPGRVGQPADRGQHDPLPRLVPPHDVPRRRDLRRGVLRVGVVDVQPGAVGQDHVGEGRVLGVGQLAGVGQVAVDLEPSGVAQRGLVLVVPPRLARPGARAAGRRRARPARS